MKITSTGCRSVPIAALLLALPLAAAERPAPREAVAEVEMSPDEIRWRPLGRFARVDLVVSGPGGDRAQSTKGDEALVFAVDDRKYGKAPDGSYGWELRASPRISKETRERLAKAREAADRGEEVDPRKLEIPPVPPPQTGAFTIRDGKIVVPGDEEPQPERPKAADRIEGDLEVAGSLRVRGSKEFAAADPDDPAGAIHFAALEGPEVGTYFRGTASTVGGEATIPLPPYFAKVTEAEGLTVQLTPLAAGSRLWVAEKSVERLVVRSETGVDASFDFLIQGVRRGYADFDVERPAGPRR